MGKAFIPIIATIILGIVAGFWIAGSSVLQSPEQNVLESPVPARPEIKGEQILQKRIEQPKTIKIEKIGVNAIIESVGLDKDNKMDVPKSADNVAWYNLGRKPGEKGSAVMAGHLDKVSGAPAVFYKLSTLSPGDKINIEDHSGNSYNFIVTKVSIYPDKQFPLQDVFAAPTDKARLNLITCEGVFDQSTGNYSDRVVVYSELES